MNRDTSNDIQSKIIPLDYPYLNKTDYSFPSSDLSAVTGPPNSVRAPSRTIQPLFPLAFLSVKPPCYRSLCSTLSLFTPSLLTVLDGRHSPPSVCSNICYSFDIFAH